MGLRGVHILFIVASIGLSIVVGAWGLQQYRAEGSVDGLVLAALFLAVGVALAVYGRHFARKSKDLPR